MPPSDGERSDLHQELQEAINDLWLALWRRAVDGVLYCVVCDHELGSGHEQDCSVAAIEKYVHLPPGEESA